VTTEPRRKLDEYEPGEMALPEFKLLQAVGGDYAKELGAKPGQFFCTTDDTIAEALEIVVVDIQTTRTYWGREEIEDSPPVCASLDAKSMQSMTGEDCSTCSHRCDTPWLLKPQERRQMCNLNYVIMGINTADFMPLIIRAGGISALPVRQLITQLRLNRALRGDYHRAIIGITSVKKKTSAGEAYVLHPRIKELITDEAKAKELKAESQRLLGAPIPLPEARPEEEGEPLGFTPEGKPFYTEEERDKLLAEETAPPTTEKLKPAVTPPVTAKKPEPKKEEKKEPTKAPLDLDF
jgi:hypothetical protein